LAYRCDEPEVADVGVYVFSPLYRYCKSIIIELRHGGADLTF